MPNATSGRNAPGARGQRVSREPPRPRHPVGLWTADLQRKGSGRWDAGRVAAALGVPLAILAAALGEKHSTVARYPAGARLQLPLTAFVNVVGVLRDTFEGDQAKVLAWLRQAQPALGGLTPLDAMLRRGQAPAVEQWLTRVWLGEPE